MKHLKLINLGMSILMVSTGLSAAPLVSHADGLHNGPRLIVSAAHHGYHHRRMNSHAFHHLIRQMMHTNVHHIKAARKLRHEIHSALYRMSSGQLRTLNDNFDLRHDYLRHHAIYRNDVKRIDRADHVARHEHSHKRVRHHVQVQNGNSIASTGNIAQLGDQGSSWANDVRNRLIDDINGTRLMHGLTTLNVTDALQSAANYRTRRVQYAYDHLHGRDSFDQARAKHPEDFRSSNVIDNWVHGGYTHDSGYQYLESHHYDLHGWSANATNIITAKNGVNGDGAPFKYTNDNPVGVADNIDDTFMNHDTAEGNHNGHRDNELNPNWKYLGVGVYYNYATHQGTANEQFAD